MTTFCYFLQSTTFDKLYIKFLIIFMELKNIKQFSRTFCKSYRIKKKKNSVKIAGHNNYISLNYNKKTKSILTETVVA